MGKMVAKSKVLGMHVVVRFSRVWSCVTGKVLIIGGGIANFTNVAATFKVLVHMYTCTCIYKRICTMYVRWNPSNKDRNEDISINWAPLMYPFVCTF